MSEKIVLIDGHSIRMKAFRIGQIRHSIEGPV